MMPSHRLPLLGRSFVAAVAILLLPAALTAAPLSTEEIERLCAGADGPVDCGRKVEAVQLTRLPRLATREDDTLKVTLYPSGTAPFADVETSSGGRYYALWDFLDPINAAVIFTIDGDDTKFTVLQRVTGRKVELPAEPKLSPDRQRLVTADFCKERCVNELAVWRVSRDGIRKELAWKPAEAWVDAAASWKDADTLAVEYTVSGESAAKTLERRLDEPRWQRIPPP
jgi:hypothetical protein